MFFIADLQTPKMAKNKKKSAEQKAQKAEKQLKKANKKSNKKNDDMDDFDDLEKLLNEFKKKDEKLTNISETVVKQPSVRSSATLTAHESENQIYLFGGEHNKGNKTFVYNDLFIYKINSKDKSKEHWVQVNVPNPPPPRCGHQAIISPNNGGELWVFGGEFSSPNGNQFYHYKDLWLLNLKSLSSKEPGCQWEQISAKNMKNCPSARSGHRMVYSSSEKKFYVFGGFNEKITEFIYYNDLYSFSVVYRCWTKIIVQNPNSGPSVRSACQFVALGGQGFLLFFYIFFFIFYSKHASDTTCCNIHEFNNFPLSPMP